jgi:ankyrin repeat protein
VKTEAINRILLFSRTTYDREHVFVFQMSDEDSYKRLLTLCHNLFLGQASLDDIEQWLNDNEGDYELLVKAANYQNDECKATPIMCLVTKGPSLDLAKRLFQLAPAAVKLLNAMGQTSLHAACYFKASPDLTRMLFTAYPEAALIKDKNGSLPVHFACETSMGAIKLETLDLLISSFPKCLSVKDGEGMLPADYIEEYGDVAPFLLHEAIVGKLSVTFVKLLLQVFPDSCVTQDDKGMIPLHYACASKAPQFLEYVMLLLDASSMDSLTIQDHRGRTPMQLLSSTVSIPDKNGMLPLHRLAATSNKLSQRSLRLLVDTFGESISMADKHGMLPFHHACLNREALLEVLMLFIEMSPDVIKCL